MEFNSGRCNPSSVMNKSLSSLPLTKKKNNKKTDVSSNRAFPNDIGTNGAHRRSVSDTGKKYLVPRISRKRIGSAAEDLNFEKQFGEESFGDESECTWLSSDCSSTSSFFEQYSKSPQSHCLVDEWLGSLLPKRGTCKAVGSVEEEPSAPRNIFLDLFVKDEGAESWLLSPSEAEDEPSENATSTSCSFESPVQDLDVMNKMRSLASLDEKHCKWISDADYDRSGNHKAPSSTGCSFSSEDISEAVLLSDHENEPLFWPFETKFDCRAEDTLEYFTMSPRKNVAARSRRLDLGVGLACRRRLEFSSESSKSVKPSAGSCESLGKKHTTPSTLSRNSRNLAQVVPLSPENSSNPIEKQYYVERDLLWEADLSFINEVSIEKLLGLNEFDGQEGIDADFNRDAFLLDGSFLMF